MLKNDLLFRIFCQPCIFDLVKTLNNKISLCVIGNYLKTLFRNRHSEVFLGKGVLKKYSKFTGERPCWMLSLFNIELPVRKGNIFVMYVCIKVFSLVWFTFQSIINLNVVKYDYGFMSPICSRFDKLMILATILSKVNKMQVLFHQLLY